MFRLLRFALLLVLTFLVLGLIVAVGTPETGPIEKSVLVIAIGALLAAGMFVGRLGSHA